jgi:hypothetical protein
MSLHRCNKKTDKLYLELSDCEILYAIQVSGTIILNGILDGKPIEQIFGELKSKRIKATTTQDVTLKFPSSEQKDILIQ